MALWVATMYFRSALRRRPHGACRSLIPDGRMVRLPAVLPMARYTLAELEEYRPSCATKLVRRTGGTWRPHACLLGLCRGGAPSLALCRGNQTRLGFPVRWTREEIDAT